MLASRLPLLHLEPARVDDWVPAHGVTPVGREFGSALHDTFQADSETLAVHGYMYDGVPQAQFAGRDWCKKHSCTRGVGVDRQFMPQLADNDGLRTLVRIISETYGVPAAEVLGDAVADAEIDTLIPIQGNADAGKVSHAFQELVQRGQHPDKRFVGKFDPPEGSNFAEKVAQLSRTDPFTTLVVQNRETGNADEFVLDGHHRYFAVSTYNRKAAEHGWPQVHSLPARRIQLPAGVTVDDVLKITLDDPRFAQRRIDDRPSLYTVREKPEPVFMNPFRRSAASAGARAKNSLESPRSRRSK